MIFKDKAEKDIRKLSLQCLRNTVSMYIDDLILSKLNKEDLIERGVIKGIENLEDALSEKKGVILVSGHFTGNRVSKLLLRNIGFPVLSVRKKYPSSPSMSLVERKYFAPVWSAILGKVIQDNIFVEDDSCSIELFKRLRNNGVVSILFDAITTPHVAACPFFGNPRFFPTNFLRIANLTGAAIIPMLCVGNSSSFTIMFEKKLELKKHSDKEEFISMNLPALVKTLELQILQYPTQWLII